MKRKKSYFCKPMGYLILAILCSAGVFVTMRLFDRYGIDNHQAIAMNYAVATAAGLLMSKSIEPVTQVVSEPWFGLSLLTGFWFIFTYLLMAYSSQKSGMTITSLSSKLSVVIPTTLGIILFHERLNMAAGFGIMLALVALYLVVSRNDSKQDKGNRRLILFPVIIFFGTGIGDMLMKFTERLNEAPDMSFMIAFIYFIAMLFGLLLVAYDAVKGKAKLQWKNLVGGTALGLVNYFSTYCVYQCMRQFDNVVLFPLYNIGVVCCTALVGLLIFKEKLTRKNLIGLALAIIAVILIASRP